METGKKINVKISNDNSEIIAENTFYGIKAELNLQVCVDSYDLATLNDWSSTDDYEEWKTDQLYNVKSFFWDYWFPDFIQEHFEHVYDNGFVIIDNHIMNYPYAFGGDPQSYFESEINSYLDDLIVNKIENKQNGKL